MQRIILNTLFFIGSVFILASCGGSNGNDVSHDPKYADIYNQIFNATQPLYYYHYTHSEGSKSGYFLSAQPEMPTAKLEEELPTGSRVIVHKVLEIPTESGGVNITVQGKAFPHELHEGLEFLATWEDVKVGLANIRQ